MTKRKNAAAVALGRIRSARKTAAARANGARGGRCGATERTATAWRRCTRVATHDGDCVFGGWSLLGGPHDPLTGASRD